MRASYPCIEVSVFHRQWIFTVTPQKVYARQAVQDDFTTDFRVVSADKQTKFIYKITMIMLWKLCESDILTTKMATYDSGEPDCDTATDGNSHLIKGQIEKKRDGNSAVLRDDDEDSASSDIELTGCGATAACNPHRALHRFLALILICFLSFGKKKIIKLKLLLKTLKWPRYFYSRWCPRGGSMEPPPEKTTFPPGFCQWNLHHICTGHKKSQFCKKKF